MEISTIKAVGFGIGRGPDVNTYTLRVWTRVSGMEANVQDDYAALSFTEMIDVMLAHLDQNRPGWQVIDGTYQPPLWAD